jgi:hypothetical protein
VLRTKSLGVVSLATASSVVLDFAADHLSSDKGVLVKDGTELMSKLKLFVHGRANTERGSCESLDAWQVVVLAAGSVGDIIVIFKIFLSAEGVAGSEAATAGQVLRVVEVEDRL